MGNLCNKPTFSVPKKPLSPDIRIQPLKGNHESLFEMFDCINIFKNYTIQDYMFILSTTFDQNTGVDDGRYLAFIEKKLIKNQQVSNWILNDDLTRNQIQDFHQKFFSIFLKGFKTFYKSIKDEKYTNNNLPYICFLAIGIVFCQGRIDNKIDIIFNSISNDGEYIEKSDDFVFFIFSCMCIPTGIFLFVLKELSDENEDYKAKIGKFEFERIFDTYQIKDATNSTKEYMKLLFSEDKSRLSYDEFYSLFKVSDDLKVIFNPASIRNWLERNNI